MATFSQESKLILLMTKTRTVDLDKRSGQKQLLLSCRFLPEAIEPNYFEVAFGPTKKSIHGESAF